MKKVITALILATAVSSAFGVEVGVNTTRDLSGTNRNSNGLTVGQSYGKVGITAGYDTLTKGKVDQDRYSVTGSYEVAKVGSIGVAVKAGAVYLDNQSGKDGYAITGGVGASYPLTKVVAATVDYRYQMGQSRVSASDGNAIGVGLKVSF